MTRLQQHLVVALLAAMEAGEYFRARLEAEKTVKTKSSPSDLVTDVDPVCEARIRDRIMKVFPSHQILGEESTAPGSEASRLAVLSVAEANNLWIVDPLDGTTNFVCRIPLSAVSIAYAEHGVIELGVVYDPYREEIFFALRNVGAWRASTTQISQWVGRGGAVEEFYQAPAAGISEAGTANCGTAGSIPPEVWHRLTVSREDRFSRCVAATGLPTRGPMHEQTTWAAVRVASQIKSFRALGSAALQLAYVAAGRLDLFWEFDLNAWDVAAGVCLVEAAGGCVEDISGARYSLAVRDIVAGGQAPVVSALQHVISTTMAMGSQEADL